MRMLKKVKVVKHEEKKLIHPKVFEPTKIPNEDRTLGQRASDSLTSGMGSWGFITFFLTFLLVWIAINFYGWTQAWDPYPFILLNLCLSCLAAIQAPIILMSQNRSEQKDRVRQEYDYTVDRHALRQVNKIYKEITYLRSDIDVIMKKYKRAKSAAKK
tara:strand:- start:1127 stop:1600 length:474 start_codon:yes stop_codon:yes gene_type:complete